uniref:Immunoglobulin domain-containing protein n=1 Tax=Xiphophorus maculatus TaxID=8083 RepID=A0A3B5PRP5_XIPMA
MIILTDLLDGSKDHHLHKEAGSSLTVACSFNFSGKTKYFCRGECEEGENILVYTDGVRAQSSRYSIGHGKHKSSAVFYVTIKNLTTSDSGRYRCLSYLSSRKNSYVDFNVSVSDGERDGKTVSKYCQIGLNENMPLTTWRTR